MVAMTCILLSDNALRNADVCCATDLHRMMARMPAPGDPLVFRIYASINATEMLLAAYLYIGKLF